MGRNTRFAVVGLSCSRLHDTRLIFGSLTASRDGVRRACEPIDPSRCHTHSRRAIFSDGAQVQTWAMNWPTCTCQT